MPNRIIREAILASDKVDRLDAASEVFYRRLLSKVDDYGRFDARPSILRSALFPLRVDRVREADCSRWIAACEKAGLIALYSHAGKPYLEVLNTGWTKRSASKYPDPIHLQAIANICTQVQTNVRLDGDVDVDVVVDEFVDVGVGVSPARGRKKTEERTLPDWVDSLEGADAVQADDPVFGWAQSLGIPADWVSLAWFAFEGRYWENGKRYKDWRAVFRKAVKEDWLRLWRKDGRTGDWVLTTAGEMAMREMQA